MSTGTPSFRPYVDTLRSSFDSIAVAYEQVRPGYPPALYERILAFAGIERGRLLEVGVGTGKATRPFAERGFAIYGLEPGERLAEVARAGLAEFSEVQVEATSFEAWTPEVAAFALAFSAQAYHWLAPAERVGKFALALRPGGTLAVFGNVPLVAPGPLHDELQDIYRRIAPALFERRGEKSWYASAESPIASELAASTHFADASFEQFTWARTLSSSQYALLLSTYSDHATLPHADRSALLSAVSSAIERYGGSLTLGYSTGLFLARRAH